MNTFDWSKVRWNTRARVGSVVAFLFDDESRRVTAGQLGLVVWAADKDENGRAQAGRDVLLDDGRTVNIPNYELRPANVHARRFTPHYLPSTPVSVDCEFCGYTFRNSGPSCPCDPSYVY